MAFLQKHIRPIFYWFPFKTSKLCVTPLNNPIYHPPGQRHSETLSLLVTSFPVPDTRNMFETGGSWRVAVIRDLL